MARLPDLQLFAAEHGLKIGTIADLIQYRSRNESLVEKVGSRPLRTVHGEFVAHAYRDQPSGELHLALVVGQWQPQDVVPVRVHEPLSVLDALEVDRGMHSCKLDAALRRLHQQGLPPAPVLCADTTVALGRHILGKPADAREAAAMLRQLAGGTHRVITALALQAGERRHEALSDSRVRFAPMSETELADYLASGEWQGKAGAYAIQGRAAAFIAHISGSYSGIMGLPLFETAALLREFGYSL